MLNMLTSIMAFERPLYLLAVTILAVCCSEDTSKGICKESFSGAASQTHTTNSSDEDGLPKSRDGYNRCEDPVNRLYRTFDGTCNHANNLGASFTPADHLLPPAFDDGVNSPRALGVDGLPLPSARNITLKLLPAVDKFINFPSLVMQWGQWVAHDMVNVAGRVPRVSCCGPSGGCPFLGRDKNCFPIELTADETHFPGVCMHFGRTNASKVSSHIPARYRQQNNEATSFLDGSQIYGSTNDTAALLREPGGFLLRTKNGSFLPESNTSCIRRDNSSDYCFLAGDFRSSQQAYLSALHTIWLREHNRIARRLKSIKPNLPNEEIFQLCRKIIVAIQQYITYSVYLPIILGDDATLWKLTSTSGRSVYNPDVNPTILIPFTSAAFRFAHTNIASLVSIGKKQVLLRNLFNQTAEVLDDFDGVVAGLAGVAPAGEQKIQATDRSVVEDISNFMFLNPKTGTSIDLVSFDIQRGRDHGVASYVKWRSYCGLRPLTGFSDTEALGDFGSEIGTVYRSVEDIDLIIGMLSEPVDTGMLGPTGRCIVRIQFFRNKYGDRFFFDNNELYSSFTDDQLAEIRKVTLSKVICQNANLQEIPRNLFRLQSRWSNPLIKCTTLKAKDLNLELFV